MLAQAPWVIHLILMLSYLTMLVLIMFFLADMARAEASTGASTCSAYSPRSAC